MIPQQDETRLRAAASGVLPNGKPVIVNADGTVSVVAETARSQSLGTSVVFDNGAMNYTATTFDSNSNKIVVAWRDHNNSYRGTAAVGTIDTSDNSISFGSDAVFETGDTINITATFDSTNNKVIIAYTDAGNSSYGTIVSGSISGTSISFGTPEVFESSGLGNISLVYDSTLDRIGIFYSISGNSDGEVKPVQASGTGFGSFPSGTKWNGSTNVFQPRATLASNVAVGDATTPNRFVLVYANAGDNNSGYVIIGKLGASSVSFGSAVEYEAGEPNNHSVAFDESSGKCLIAFADQGNANKGKGVVGTITSSSDNGSISVGSPTTFHDAATYRISNVFDPTSGKYLIAYSDASTSNGGTFVIATVSGTSVSFSSETAFEAGEAGSISTAYDSNADRIVISYEDETDSDQGNSVVVQTAATVKNLTAENYIGMSGGEVTFVNQAIGSEVQFASGIEYPASTFDSNSNKIVIAYADTADSYKGKALVGTVNSSNNSISFGSATIFETGNTQQISNVSFDSNSNRVVVAYNDAGNSNRGTAVVGSVSGTSISFGTPVVFGIATTNYLTTTFDSNSNKVIIAYSDGNNSGYGTAIVGTVDSSDNSISFGTATVFESADTAGTNATFDSSSNKVLVSYIDQGNSIYGTSVVGTVSGTSISFGSAVLFKADRVTDIYSAFDTNSNKVVIAYQDRNATGSVTQYGAAVVGTISGTSISFGTSAYFQQASTAYISMVFDSSLNKVVITYRDTANSGKGGLVIGTVSGTDISFGSEVIFKDAEVYTAPIGPAYDSNSNKVVIGYRLAADNTGKAIVFQSSNVIRGQVASGSSASVDIIGTVSENQTGLTAGQSYFVQTDGTIALTAGSPSVFAGTAISATKLLVKT